MTRVITDVLAQILFSRVLASVGVIITAVFQTANETLGPRLVVLEQARIGAVLEAFASAQNVGQPGTWAPKPEPSTALLLAAGLVGLRMRLRQRPRWDAAGTFGDRDRVS